MESFFEWMLESSLLILMIIGIRKIFTGRIRYAGIYALWGLVLLRFVIPVSFVSTPVSVANIISGLLSAEASTESAQEVIGNTDEVVQWDAKPETALGYEEANKISKSEQQIDGGKIKQNNALSNTKNNTVQKNLPESTANGITIHCRALWHFFCCGWVVISTLLFLWFLLSNITLLRKLKQNRIFWEQRGSVKIYAAYDIKTPCLYGFFRPSIYLPAHLILADEKELISQQELEQMITHELVHYHHKDHIWAMLRILLVSIYWFDPFMWLACFYSKKDAELFCDETVLQLLSEENRFSYGEMLVRLAGDKSWGDFRYSMMAMSRRGKEMEKRIRAISERKHYSKWIVVPLAIILFGTASITGSAGIALPAREDKQAAEQKNTDHGNTKNADGMPTKQPTANPSPESEKISAEQIAIYSDYLKEHAKDDGYQYYSLAWLDADHLVLLVSDHVNAELPTSENDSANTATAQGTSACQVYNIVDGKTVSCGKIACSSSGEWIHFSDGKLLTDTHHSMTRIWVDTGTTELLTETIEENLQESDSETTEIPEWLREFAAASSVAFYTNPYLEKKKNEGEPDALSLQNNGASYLIDDHSYDSFMDVSTDSGQPEDNASVTMTATASTPEEAFDCYMEVFTEAVNTGNIEKMEQVLAVGSDIYEMQCALVKNYYKRGIHEKVKSYSITAIQEQSDSNVEIDSMEKIKVFYGDDTSKIVKQQYRYTCEYIDHSWVITKMKEINV